LQEIPTRRRRMYLVISTSLNPKSRSRVMARIAAELFRQRELPAELIDLQQHPLPLCDAGPCYGDPNARALAAKIAQSRGVLIASPVYNYDLSAAAKNLVELTGKAWTEKVVGFLVSAGGRGSLMSVMGLANSLMLDFRSLIVPRFVYATEDSINGDELADPQLRQRIEQLVADLVRIAASIDTASR
jgi:FMN reductase